MRHFILCFCCISWIEYIFIELLGEKMITNFLIILISLIFLVLVNKYEIIIINKVISTVYATMGSKFKNSANEQVVDMYWLLQILKSMFFEEWSYVFSIPQDTVRDCYHNFFQNMTSIVSMRLPYIAHFSDFMYPTVYAHKVLKIITKSIFVFS